MIALLMIASGAVGVLSLGLLVRLLMPMDEPERADGTFDLDE